MNEVEALRNHDDVLLVGVLGCLPCSSVLAARRVGRSEEDEEDVICVDD